MNRTRMFLVAAALLLAPYGRVHAVTAPDTSFVDFDNDGVRSPGDRPLSDYAGPGLTGFNEFGGNTGAKGPVGIVLEGNVVLGDESGDMKLFFVRGNITVRGNVTIKSRDTLLWLMTNGGKITFAPGVVVKGNGQMMFQAASGGTISVGDGAVFSTRGYDGSDVTFAADRDVTVGARTSFTTAAGYSNIEFQSGNTLRIAPGLKMRGPNHGGITITAHADLDLAGLDVRTGYVHIEAFADDAHPAAKRLHIASSKFYQTYKNGEFRLLANPDARTLRFAPDALVLTKVLVSTKTPWPLYYPENPTIQ